MPLCFGFGWHFWQLNYVHFMHIQAIVCQMISWLNANHIVMLCQLLFGLSTFGAAILALVWFLVRRTAHPKTLMAVIGSGGHTAEMLTLVQTILASTDPTRINLGESMVDEVVFVVSDNDQLSRRKLVEAFPQLSGPTTDKPTKSPSVQMHLRTITRSRAVHQSYLSSVATTLVACAQSLPLVWHTRPGLLLCNGPGVCVPLVLATRLLLSQSVVIFVESFCRTRTLSLTGKLMYHLRLAHHFLVQWPTLIERYPRAQHLGGFLV